MAFDVEQSIEMPGYRPAKRGGRRVWVWLVAALVAVGAIVGALLLYMPNRVQTNTLDPLKVAVLPFVNLSDPSDDLYFVDGISEEIMRALAAVPDIRVVAKTSTFSFRDSKVDARTIGQKLNAGSVLQGTVRREPNRLRMSAQLIDANSGLPIWAESYDRRPADIFEMQNQISTAVAARLVDTLPSGTRLSSSPTADLDAYTLFLRANHLMRRRGAENLTRSIGLFQEAIKRDPNFARAYAGLAEALTLQPSYAGTSEKAALPLALDAATRAEALGEKTARVLGVRAFVHFRSREWQAAKDGFERAIALNPNDSDLLQWYSQFLAGIGWIERAERAAKDAVAIDPLSTVANQRAGVVSVWTNDASAADSHFSAMSDVGVEGSGLPEASIAFLLSEGRLGEARTALIETQHSRGQSIDWIDPVFAALAKTGSTSAALDALHRDYANGKLGVSLYVGAMLFLGDVDGFYRGMNDVVASGEPFDVEVLFSRTGRPLREDARFVELASELRLIDFWDKAGWPDMCARESSRIVCR